MVGLESDCQARWCWSATTAPAPCHTPSWLAPQGLQEPLHPGLLSGKSFPVPCPLPLPTVTSALTVNRVKSAADTNQTSGKTLSASPVGFTAGMSAASLSSAQPSRGFFWGRLVVAEQAQVSFTGGSGAPASPICSLAPSLTLNVLFLYSSSCHFFCPPVHDRLGCLPSNATMGSWCNQQLQGTWLVWLGWLNIVPWTKRSPVCSRWMFLSPHIFLSLKIDNF